MALLPQNPRDQKLFVLGLVAVALAVGYQQVLWKPAHDEQALLAARLDTLEMENAATKREVAKGNSAKMRQEADAFGRELLVLRRLVPTENEVPELLEGVSTAARRAGLELSDIRPDGGVLHGDQFDTYKYRLAVTGPWHEIADFLANVGSLPRIVSPINLSLAISTRVGERRPRKDEQFIEAKFGIQTYVAHTAPRTAGATAQAGAP